MGGDFPPEVVVPWEPMPFLSRQGGFPRLSAPANCATIAGDPAKP